LEIQPKRKFTIMRAAIVFLLVLVAASASFAQSRDTVAVNDNSDWWSIIRDNSAGETLRPRAQDVPAANFRILGITLGSDDLDAIQKTLGSTTVVTRGDAATARSQICYTALDGRSHLNFESGEVQYGFYLFIDGEQWSGSDRCKKSELITSGLTTLSGLHLGQTQGEVQAILGKPTALLKNGDIVFFRQVRKRTSAPDLKKARQYYSSLSEQQFHENYDFYDMSAYIVARFSSAGLVYLGVSKSDTY
jgi:hypothetical protein